MVLQVDETFTIEGTPMTFEEWWDSPPPGDDSLRSTAKGAWEAGVAAERERCAKVAEEGQYLHPDAPTARFGREVAAAIRRG